jgi:hypothetical protein
LDCVFIADDDADSVPGSLLRERMLKSADPAGTTPQVVLQRRLMAGQATDKWAQSDRLDNEIRIGVQLARAFSEDYPAELSQLVGFDIDVEEPFLLLLPPRGVPAKQVVSRLRIEQERLLEASLFRALRYLEVAGVVHTRISPATVLWEDAGHASKVQLIDFSHAVLAGEPRQRGGQRPWVSSEQFAGTGNAAPADDAWSAGHLIYHVTTGYEVRAGELPDLAVRGAPMQVLLADMFAAQASQRPSGTKLLARLRLDDPWPDGATAMDHPFVTGLRAFDMALMQKYPARVAPEAPTRQQAAASSRPAQQVRNKQARNLPGCLGALTAVALLILFGTLLGTGVL